MPVPAAVSLVTLGVRDIAALRAAAAAGAAIPKPAHATHWGGYSGYFADPGGHLWEGAHNPFRPLGPDGPPQVP